MSQCIAVCSSVVECVVVILVCYRVLRMCGILNCRLLCVVPEIFRATGICKVRQCVAVCCSVLQCVAVYCRALQCVAVYYSVLQYDAVCCSVLQCVAGCCSVLQ